MRWLKAIWFWLTTSTQFALIEAENKRLLETNLVLEEENATLRKEVRAITNTVLGQAGVAPLPPAEEVKPVPRMHKLTPQQQRRRLQILEDIRAVEGAKELRKKFEETHHVVPRSN